MPAWPEVRLLVARELGEPVSTPAARRRAEFADDLGRPGAENAGALVVKVRHGDRATRRRAGARPACRCSGRAGIRFRRSSGTARLGGDWHVTVQNRLPGHPARPLAGPLLDALLRLVELQAGAGIPAEDRDFTGYVANVLFDDWDEVWDDAPRACAAAGPLCARIRRWLQPVWGLRLPPADYAHNDLNLSNVLTDGERITGVVDWDEFGLGSRALDLVAARSRLLAHAATARRRPAARAGGGGRGPRRAALPGQLPCARRAGRLRPRAAGVRRFPRGRGMRRALAILDRLQASC